MEELCKHYIVQPGDTLSGIASKRLGNSNRYREIAIRNGLSNPNLIYPGTTLILPPSERCTQAVRPPTKRELADLKATKQITQTLAHDEVEALNRYGPGIGFFPALLKTIDLRHTGPALFTGASVVQRSTKAVEKQAQALGKAFLAEIRALQSQHLKNPVNSSNAYRQAQNLMEKYDDLFNQKIFESFRDRMGGRYATKEFSKMIRQQAAHTPKPLTTMLERSQKAIKVLKGVGAALFAVDSLLTVRECVKDFGDGNGMEKCSSELGRFGLGTATGVTASWILLGLNPGGWLLVGASLTVAGLSVGGAVLGESLARWNYQRIMGED